MNIYVLYLWLDDAMLVEWSEAYSLLGEMLMDIYIWFTFSLYVICIASHSLHWHMELCREPMVPTVPV